MKGLLKKAIAALSALGTKSYFQLGKATAMQGESNWTSLNYSKRRGKFKKRNRQYS